MKNFIIAFIILVACQTLAYFQLQSQFFWNWAKTHPFTISLLGIPISYMLILFTKYCALAFNGQTWPGRLVGFAVGAIVFAVLSHICLKEPFTPKTIVCLSLSGLILLIQVIWR